MPATLNVIFGPCGAGKTTYAHALARREGVAGRNTNKGETFVREVTPQMFELLEGLYEAPAPIELENAVRSVSD